MVVLSPVPEVAAWICFVVPLFHRIKNLGLVPSHFFSVHLPQFTIYGSSLHSQ